jgi:hypothetical protein
VATATKRTAQSGDGALKQASGRITRTVEASVTEKPSRQEVIVDAALLAAGALEAISPPAAVAVIALNRLVHVAK